MGVAQLHEALHVQSLRTHLHALTGTPLAHLQKREKGLEYARAIVDGLSLRKAANRVGRPSRNIVSLAASVPGDLQRREGIGCHGIVEADETSILKSAKGSKRRVGRARESAAARRKREGFSTEEHDCVLIVRDRSGATTDHILADLRAPTFAADLAPIVARDAVLVSDGRDAYGAFAHAEHILHIAIIT